VGKGIGGNENWLNLKGKLVVMGIVGKVKGTLSVEIYITFTMESIPSSIQTD